MSQALPEPAPAARRWGRIARRLAAGTLVYNGLEGIERDRRRRRRRQQADPAAALLMVPWLVREGLEGLRGEDCC